jgi:hypothetical protein
MSEVKLLIFNNGIELIGAYRGKDAENTGVVLEKPVRLIMVPNQNSSGVNQVGMAFAPFLEYTEEWKTGISFSPADLLTVTTPVAELKNQYSATYGSGIVIPSGLRSV